MNIKFKKNKGNKIFCIGNNKTGTTSLAKLFSDHNFDVANQSEAEKLLNDYKSKNWSTIIKYCNKYEVFQDVPFSLPYTFIILDHVFPNSKFVLSVRDNSEQWYNSIFNFHSKLFADGKNRISKDDLRKANYVYEGWILDLMKEVYGDFEDVYNKERLKKIYDDNNNFIRNYFKNKDNFISNNIHK